MQTFYVSKRHAKLRLDKFLVQELGLSRREALKLLEHNLVTLNGRPASSKDKGSLLETGWQVAVADPERVLQGVIVPDPDIPLTVLAEGSGLVVVDKPARMPVLPKTVSERGTVLNALVARYPQLQGVGEGGLNSGVVHRLDTDTSGVLAVATEEEVWQELRSAFKAHRVRKRYRAIVQGPLEGMARETPYLVVARHRPAFVRVLGAEEGENTSAARQCSLTWRSLETFKRATLVEVDLETGFLHQIRAVFSQLGHPVLGDRLYGDERAFPGVLRHMLHAAYLELPMLEAHSPDPEDFSDVLDGLRG